MSFVRSLLLLAFFLPTVLGNLFYLESDPKCPWVFAIVALVTISFLCSLVCTLLNCICCVEKGR
ncbi:hypothetical protein M3Y99_00959500 [Aphelenchoides fujianensis]|nr:hypothetical protein M3Y99_00959500 [Aphelenchoides fujianensis]